MTHRPTGKQVDELREEFATEVDVEGSRILLVRLGDEVRAVSGWCTHLRTRIGEQAVEADGLVECPLHGALFDTADGSLQLGPSCSALPVYDVEVGPDGGVAVRIDAQAAAEGTPRTSSFGDWGAVGSDR